MSKFGVSQEKERALEARLQTLEIHEEDLEETFVETLRAARDANGRAA